MSRHAMALGDQVGAPKPAGGLVASGQEWKITATLTALIILAFGCVALFNAWHFSHAGNPVQMLFWLGTPLALLAPTLMALRSNHPHVLNVLLFNVMLAFLGGRLALMLLGWYFPLI